MKKQEIYRTVFRDSASMPTPKWFIGEEGSKLVPGYATIEFRGTVKECVEYLEKIKVSCPDDDVYIRSDYVNMSK